MPITEAVINTDPSTDTDIVDQPTSENFHPLLFGGNQLTAARARSSQERRTNYFLATTWTDPRC